MQQNALDEASAVVGLSGTVVAGGADELSLRVRAVGSVVEDVAEVEVFWRSLAAFVKGDALYDGRE